MGDLTSNFSEWEFECPCCGKRGVKQELILFAQGVRDQVNHSVSINSGMRCPKHNEEEGGAEDSDHLTGEGIDISCTTSRLRFYILRAALRAGYTRIGIGKSFIHVGMSLQNPQHVIWNYS